LAPLRCESEGGASDTAISSTSASAPKDAVKSYQKARNEWLDKKPDRAQDDLQKDDFAGALQHLRNCLTYFPPGPDFDLVKQQIAQIEPAVKKTS